MATIWLIPCSSSLIYNTRTLSTIKRPSIPCSSSPSVQFHSLKASLSHSHSHSPHHFTDPTGKSRFLTVSAVVDEESVIAEEINGETSIDSSAEVPAADSSNRARPCELYICNLPRSCDIPQLEEMFKPHGTVLSVEVSRNPETGVSRGCGYVTMNSINAAKKAIVALDGSDVEGRDMRVRFSVDMNQSRNPDVLNSAPKRNLVYESPHKIYVGNLSRTVTPEHLRSHFDQFGTIVSARVLHDRKSGKYRIYGFLSFFSASERDASLSLNGTEFCGRTLIVREGLERSEP